MSNTSFLRVVVGKIDLDTIGAAWLLGVSDADDIRVVRGEASAEDLADPNVVCIEVGGSGRVEERNFDHHGESSEDLPSATKQVSEEDSVQGCVESDWKRIERGFSKPDVQVGPSLIPPAQRIIEYINIFDIQGPEEIRRLSSGEPPFLSDIVSGILLVKRDSREQLLEGVRVLQLLAASGIDPFGSVQDLVEEHPDLSGYVEAKAENNRRIAEALENASWGFTRSGLKMAWLETSFPGALGALYNSGAQVVVAFNPDLKGVRKFTIGGNGVRVSSIQPLLNEVEEGWGGPGSGTILGSPKEGSVMELSEVVRIVMDNL